MYLSEFVPGTGVHPVIPSADLAHSQLTLVGAPSRSVSVAVIRVPMSPRVGDILTSPSSSTLYTSTVTSNSSDSLPERAVIVSSYLLSLSESAGAS